MQAPTRLRTARVALAAAVALMGGILMSCSGDGGSSSDVAADAPVDAGVANCPAAGRQDTFASGLTPDRIPNLPAGYSFTFVKEDKCTPVRFDPCQPIHYVINPAHAPETGVADVKEAFDRLARVTGMTFVDGGTTDEVSRRGPYVEERYPGR